MKLLNYFILSFLLSFATAFTVGSLCFHFFGRAGLPLAVILAFTAGLFIRKVVEWALGTTLSELTKLDKRDSK